MTNAQNAAAEAARHSPASSSSGGILLRDRSKDGHARVGFLELFFDLIFVFAVTQLSHGLLKDMSLANAGQTLILFLATWWVWMYTTWAMNWLDPDRPRVRMAIFALCFAGFMMAISIHDAFGTTGLAFAISYCCSQIGRTLFTVYAVWADRVLRTNFMRILVWFCLTAPLWIGGALVEGPARAAFWLAALGIDALGPILRFPVPGMGVSHVSDWTIEGEHMAERCALFIIIALGESLLITGATFEKLPWDGPHWAAMVAAVISAFAMWWIYFDRGLERGAHHIAHSADPGRIGRRVYTYYHAVIVLGIIAAAVGDELALAHPVGHLEAPTLLAVCGSSMIYLIGCGLFKREVASFFPLSHLVGLGLTALGAATAWFAHLDPWMLALWCAGALVATAAWEKRSLDAGLPEHGRHATGR